MDDIAHIDLFYYRGDTRRKTFVVKNKGEVKDISQWVGISLAVHTISDPPDDSTLIYTMTGVLSTDGTDGKFYVKPTDPEADDTPIGFYFYDCQAVDENSEKTTLFKGSYEIRQDRNKI